MSAGWPSRTQETPDNGQNAPHESALDKCAVCHLTPADLARRWNVSTRTLARWRSARNGPACLSLPGGLRYRLADVIAYEHAHLIGASDGDET